MSKNLIISLFSLFLLVFSTLTFGEENFISELTDETFEFALKEHEYNFVMFYSSWCSRSKRLQPEFVQAAAILKTEKSSLNLVQIDCVSVGRITCDAYFIDSYPVYKVFNGSEFVQDFRGFGRTKALVQFIRTQVGPVSKELHSMDDLAKFLESDEAKIFAYFNNSQTELTKLFFQFAEHNRDIYLFAHIYDDIWETKFEPDQIVFIRASHLYNIFENSTVIFKGNTEMELSAFVKRHHHGIVGYRNTDNVMEFQKPLCVAYYAVDYIRNIKSTNYWRNRIIQVAKEFEGKMYFAISAKSHFNHELKYINMYDADNSKPIIAIHDENERVYIFNDEFSIENLKGFIEKFIRGEIEAYVRSQPIPTKNDGPVKIVVAKNFDDVVINNNKDTLIAFYASWCNNCQKLEVIFDELATKLINEDVVIAKIDGTVNQLKNNFNLQGYPTIYWLPKNAKDKPILYAKKEQKLNDFIKFIAKRATEELKGYDRKGKPKKTEL